MQTSKTHQGLSGVRTVIKMKKCLCFFLILTLFSPTIAFGAGLTAGENTSAVYIGKDGSIRQTWYDVDIVLEGCEWIVGVNGDYVYYQVANAEDEMGNASSSLFRAELYKQENEATAGEAVDETQIPTFAKTPELVADKVSGRAEMDANSGYIYYVNPDDMRTLRVVTWYPTIGKVDVAACALTSPIQSMYMTANGLALDTDDGGYLYLQLLSSAIPVSSDAENIKSTEMHSGFEIVLTDAGTLLLRADIVNNISVEIDKEVLAYTIYNNSIYYLRRTRWLSEINRFDLTTQTTSVLCRMLRELLPQIVAASDKLYVIDGEYTVYHVSPETGKYATYMLLSEPYVGYDEYEPMLSASGGELLVYDRRKDGTEQPKFYYNVYVGSQERPTVTPSPSPSPSPSPTPTATPTPPPVVYNELKRGSSGSDVRDLQTKLIDLGYLVDTVDGKFGAKVQAAVEQVQFDYDLEVTGVASNDFLHMLYDGAIAAYDEYIPLESGDRNVRVVKMQTRLRELGFLAATADGIYGQATKTAVALFQKQNGLPETGAADRETLKALYADTAPQNTAYIDLQVGDSGIRVAELVDRLIELYYLPSSKRGSVYTANVEQAVKAYQARSYQWQSGTASAYTLSRLFSDNAVENSDYIDLQYGDQNERVRQLQTRLISLGFMSSYADGKFGTATKTAVSAFQKSAGLTSNGIATTETQSRLFSQNAPTPTPTPTPKPETFRSAGANRVARVSKSIINVYEQPSTSSNVVGTMSYYTEAQLLATSTSWARVKNAFGEIGYLLLSDISIIFVKHTATPRATPSPTPTFMYVSGDSY